MPACTAGWVNASCYDDSWLPASAQDVVGEAFLYNDVKESSMFKLNVSNSVGWNQDAVEALKARDWLDRQTRTVTIQLATYVRTACRCR